MDIIAVDRNELVFVEVKARKATVDTCFPAADAVNFKKIEKIKVISDYYLDRNKNMIEKLKIKRIRHDVIGVSVNSFFSFSIDHRIDAF